METETLLVSFIRLMLLALLLIWYYRKIKELKYEIKEEIKVLKYETKEEIRELKYEIKSLNR